MSSVERILPFATSESNFHFAFVNFAPARPCRYFSFVEDGRTETDNKNCWMKTTTYASVRAAESYVVSGTNTELVQTFAFEANVDLAGYDLYSPWDGKVMQINDHRFKPK